MGKLIRILPGLLAIAGFHLCLSGLHAADLLSTASTPTMAPTPGTSAKVVLKGSFIWSKQAGKPHDLTAELTPDGPGQWKVVYTFENPLPNGKLTTYTGTITGNLRSGRVTGTAASGNPGRTFVFEGTASNGVLHFQHSETTKNRPGPTGTGILRGSVDNLPI